MTNESIDYSFKMKKHFRVIVVEFFIKLADFFKCLIEGDFVEPAGVGSHLRNVPELLVFQSSGMSCTLASDSSREYGTSDVHIDFTVWI